MLLVFMVSFINHGKRPVLRSVKKILSFDGSEIQVYYYRKDKTLFVSLQDRKKEQEQTQTGGEGRFGSSGKELIKSRRGTVSGRRGSGGSYGWVSEVTEPKWEDRNVCRR